jgi:Na+/H+-dicarboxylate symporter
MGLGALAGLFFGERVAFLKVLGDAFIALLQMSVLPYVVTSLIGEVGRLRMKEAVSLGKSVGFALVLIWVITLGTNLAMPLAFPDWEQASFYSTSLVSEPAQFDFVEQYIPINVFNSLSSNIIPAVVVFCLAVGIILIRIEEAEKETLLSVLSVLSGTLASLTTEIAKLSPYGAFAIIASLSGTLRPEELQMLQVYIAAFIVISLILVFWTLPALLVTVSPVSYSQVFRSSRDALVTAFATGSLFVVIPLLARGARELFTESDRGDKAKTSVDIAVASSLSLPTAGKILTLSYVLFAGWLAGAREDPDPVLRSFRRLASWCPSACLKLHLLFGDRAFQLLWECLSGCPLSVRLVPDSRRHVSVLSRHQQPGQCQIWHLAGSRSHAHACCSGWWNDYRDHQVQVEEDPHLPRPDHTCFFGRTSTRPTGLREFAGQGVRRI